MGQETNRDDPQINNSKLEDFYITMEREGIKYPPREFDSSILHSAKEEFACESIEYEILEKGRNNITIDTSKRGIRGLTEEETEVISQGGIHRDHVYNPYRVIATINRNPYFVKEINNGIVTLFDNISGDVKIGDKVTISRNRQGDFIIYTKNPTTIKYLDVQTQLDYKSRGLPLKIGHFSLLNNETDYTTTTSRSANETNETRSLDKILYAGTITWREDGRALFYNNDCGRYQPDDNDANYLAIINPEFKKDIVTATKVETGVEDKVFYRSHDHNKDKYGYCFKCRKNFSVKNLRRRKDEVGSEGAKLYCNGCWPTHPCGKCDVCMFGASEYCMVNNWDEQPVPT